jgi:hypothetical protein
MAKVQNDGRVHCYSMVWSDLPQFRIGQFKILDLRSLDIILVFARSLHHSRVTRYVETPLKISHHTIHKTTFFVIQRGNTVKRLVSLTTPGQMHTDIRICWMLRRCVTPIRSALQLVKQEVERPIASSQQLSRARNIESAIPKFVRSIKQHAGPTETLLDSQCGCLKFSSCPLTKQGLQLSCC